MIISSSSAYIIAIPMVSENNYVIINYSVLLLLRVTEEYKVRANSFHL
jgi:uncharacterized membrane protein (DUF441 family)